MTNHDNGRDSMLQKVIDAGTKQHPHQTDSRLPVRACPPVFFLLMNQTNTMVAPAGFTTASIVGAMEKRNQTETMTK